MTKEHKGMFFVVEDKVYDLIAISIFPQTVDSYNVVSGLTKIFTGEIRFQIEIRSPRDSRLQFLMEKKLDLAPFVFRLESATETISEYRAIAQEIKIDEDSTYLTLCGRVTA